MMIILAPSPTIGPQINLRIYRVSRRMHTTDVAMAAEIAKDNKGKMLVATNDEY